MVMRVALPGLVAAAVLFAGWKAVPAFGPAGELGGDLAGHLDRSAPPMPAVPAALVPFDGPTATDEGSAQPQDPLGEAPAGSIPATLAAPEPAISLPPDSGPAGGVTVAEAASAAGPGGLSRAALPIRVPRPVVPPGPRGIGLQAGHWRTGELPEELRRLEPQTGTSGGGVAEW